MKARNTQDWGDTMATTAIANMSEQTERQTSPVRELACQDTSVDSTAPALGLGDGQAQDINSGETRQLVERALYPSCSGRSTTHSTAMSLHEYKGRSKIRCTWRQFVFCAFDFSY